MPRQLVLGGLFQVLRKFYHQQSLGVPILSILLHQAKQKYRQKKRSQKLIIGRHDLVHNKSKFIDIDIDSNQL